MPRCCAELLCLLRLSEVALADPEPEAGLCAMAGELARLATVTWVRVALAEDGRQLRDIARAGHQRAPAGQALVMAAVRAMAEQTIVQGTDPAAAPDDSWAVVPILVGERALGVLEVGLASAPPLDAWSEHVLWAATDLMALLLLGRRDRTAAGQDGELRLTRRQRDVLFELVEHGASNEEIGDRLGLSARTVKIHLQAAYRRLGVRSRGEAIRLVLTRHAGWLASERERRQNPATARAASRSRSEDHS